MRPWIVIHIPTRCLIKIVTKSIERVLAICSARGWKSKELMIRVK